MYFQAETAQATIVDNIVFNIPRAAVNFSTRAAIMIIAIIIAIIILAIATAARPCVRALQPEYYCHCTCGTTWHGMVCMAPTQMMALEAVPVRILLTVTEQPVLPGLLVVLSQLTVVPSLSSVF